MRKFAILVILLAFFASYASDPPRTKFTGVEVTRSLVPPPCTAEYQSKKAGEICRDASTGELKRWDGNAWVAVGGGSGSGDMEQSTYDPDSDGTVESADAAAALEGSGSVPVDVDGDGTGEASMLKASPSRIGYSRLGWDTNRDGTADLIFDAQNGGFLWGDGRPFVRRPAIISFSIDTHNEVGCYDCTDGLDEDDLDDPDYRDSNVAWMILKAAEYGVPLGFDSLIIPSCESYSLADCPSECTQTDTNGDGTADSCEGGLLAEPLRYAVEHGMRPGAHTGDHCGEGPAGPFFADALSWWTQAAKPVYACGGTASITEGSNVITGSGTEFTFRCDGGSTKCAAAPGMLVLIDCNGDGKYETERIIDHSSYDDQKIWLDEVLPADCDGDGTTNETISGLALDDNTPSANPRIIIAHVWKHAKEEFVEPKEELESRIGTGYTSDWMAHPGQWFRSSGEQALLAALGIQAATTHGVNYWGALGGIVGADAPTGLTNVRMTLSCHATTDWYDFVFDRALENGGWTDFYSHPPYPESACPSTGMFFSREGMEKMLQRCQECMKDGTCICTDPATAAALDRFFDAVLPSNYNFIPNPKMLVGSGYSSDLAVSSHHAMLGWRVSARYDLDGDGTYDIDDDSTANVSYDATNDVTWIEPKSKDVEYQGNVTLRGGSWYMFYEGLVVEGLDYNAGDGYQLAILPGPYSDDAVGFTMPVLYYATPDAYPGNAYRGGGLAPLNASQKNRSLRLGTDGSARIYREIYAKFYVPPELDGMPVRIVHRVIGGDDPTNGADDDGDGSTDETDRVGIWRQTLIRIRPEQAGGNFGWAYGLPHTLTSYLPHRHPSQVQSAMQQRTAAFVLPWPNPPYSDLDLDGTYDTCPAVPDYDWVAPLTCSGSNHDYIPWKIGANGEGFFRGITGWNSGSTDEKFVHGSESGPRLDVDTASAQWFVDADRDGTRDDGEACIGPHGTDYDCDGTAEFRSVLDWQRLNVGAGQSYYSMTVHGYSGAQWYQVPHDMRFTALRCWMTESITAGSITVYFKVYNSASSSDLDHDTGLSVTLDTNNTTAKMSIAETCGSGCYADEGDYLRVYYTSDSSYADNGSDYNADLACEIVFWEEEN